MLTPSSISIINPPIATYRIHSLNDLSNWIWTCSQGQFTGRLDLDLRLPDLRHWSLFFQFGHLIGAASDTHPVRRWCRQLSQHCPHWVTHTLAQGAMTEIQSWDYAELEYLIKQDKVSREQAAALVQGNVVEILFDLIQLSAQHPSLEGHLSYRHIPPEVITATFVLIRADRAWGAAKQAWDTWQQAELGRWSPNLAPIICDAEALRKQVSLMTYHNLTTLLDRDRTLRDLATQLKQPLVPLTLSIMPHIRQGIMDLIEVKDSSQQLNPLTATAPQASTVKSAIPPTRPDPKVKPTPRPLVAYIEDSQFDSLAMRQILLRAGYQFMNVQDPIQALPILLEHKPSLIFLDLLMPIANGYEVCGQIRRTSAFQDTPIVIVTSSDGIVDRVRAKLAGSSGFIAKPIESDKVLTVLQNHLPALPSLHESN